MPYLSREFKEASYKGDLQKVRQLLLENGADKNSKDPNGDTPLHWASYYGQVTVVKLLLEKGANPNITNNNGNTPLQLAQQENKQNCINAIELFLQKQQQEEWLEKFPTYTALDQELQRLKHLIEKKEKSRLPFSNKAAEQARKEYDALLPLCNEPEYIQMLVRIRKEKAAEERRQEDLCQQHKLEQQRRKQQEEEDARKRQLEGLRQQEKAAARKRREEELRIQHEKQELEQHRRKQQEEEEARRKRWQQEQEELAKRRRPLEEASKKQRQEEELRKRREEQELEQRRKQEEELAQKRQEEGAAKVFLQNAKGRQQEAEAKKRRQDALVSKKHEQQLKQFKTRSALDRELQRLQDLMDAAKDSIDPEVNSKAEAALIDYEALLPLCDLPQYMPVSDLETEFAKLETQLKGMRIGKERTKKAHELDELRQRLEQERNDAATNDPNDSISAGRAILVNALDSPVATEVKAVSWNYVDFLSNSFGDAIASGGFGTIYSGIDMDANAQVAIKVLRSDRLSARDKEEFEKEILCLSELRHPNVVRLLAKSISANDDSRICMILEYAAGGSVASILASTSSRKLFTPSIRLYVAESLVSAIEYLHSKGIFHRDIKPENMCMHEGWEQRPHMVLVDFGIAKQIPNNVASATMTSNPGTDMFMAPEYADKTSPRFDEKSEVFSIGAVLTCLLTGGFSLLALGDATDCTTDILFKQRDENAGPWHEDVARSLSDTTCHSNRVDASERPTVKKLLHEIKNIRSQNGQLNFLSPESVRRIQTHHRFSKKSRLPESNHVRQCARCGLDRSAGITCPSSHLICMESTCLEYMARSQKGSETFRCLGEDCDHGFFLADLYSKINPDLYNELLLAQDKEVDASLLMDRISNLFESLRDDVGQGFSEVKQEVRSSKDEILLTTTRLVTSVQLETEISRDSINQSVKQLQKFAEKQERKESRLEEELKALRKQEMSGVGNQLTLERRLEEISKQLVDLSLKNAKGVAALASGRLQCPRLFILWPMRGPRRAGVRRLIYKEYRLLFLCEHDKSLVKTSVTIKHVRPWLKKVAPFVKFALFSIRILVSVYGVPIPSLPGFIPGADASEQFKEACEHMEKLLLDVDPEAMHSLRCWLEECSDCIDGDEMQELIRKYEGEVSEEAYAALATVAYKPKNRGWMSEMDIACSGTKYAWVKNENVDAFQRA